MGAPPDDREDDVIMVFPRLVGLVEQFFIEKLDGGKLGPISEGGDRQNIVFDRHATSLKEKMSAVARSFLVHEFFAFFDGVFFPVRRDAFIVFLKQLFILLR